MRITNAMITKQSQSRLQSGLAGVDRLREDISTGLRLRRMSDDPTSGAEVVRVGSSMRAITQFRRNTQRVLISTADLSTPDGQEVFRTVLTDLADRDKDGIITHGQQVQAVIKSTYDFAKILDETAPRFEG